MKNNVKTGKPQIVFKYKGIQTKEDLVRVVDIIKNHRIYMPTYDQLNDPLEGQIINIIPDGYMGCSLTLNADEEDVVVREFKEKYRILSLSEMYNIPQLWAHYANNYEGICLCFSSNKSFSRIKEVEYCTVREDINVEDDIEMKKQIERSFFMKNQGWSNEKEWRIVFCNDKRHLYFEKDELMGIIVGHNVSSEIAEFILSCVDDDVLRMRTSVGYRTYNINVVPYDYVYDYDGSPLQILDVEKTLEKKEYQYISLIDRIKSF